MTNLEDAYLAKQAAKSAPPAGVAATAAASSTKALAPPGQPRKKAPTDPFIQRKKPQRRA